MSDRLTQKPSAERPWIANAIIRSMAHDDGAHAVDGRWQSVRPPLLVHLFWRRRDESRSALPSVICAACLMTACLVALWPRGSDAHVNTTLAEDALQPAIICTAATPRPLPRHDLMMQDE